ncbi:hypothetical protein J5Y03_01755 [Bacillus sp. RG28]|uniref:DUF5668 domain-containing protein n=1 Tax=Gottfriedia endophytica TaxID=2820819 RepID=A0A940NN83_9BACI|nr:hypothetical protein [Gottfriedia endophytica]MBP0723907.1 hypothetical protein [Gottfriedia endophytica]
MRKNRLFLGILLIGFGLFYFISKWHIASLQSFNDWTTPLFITSIALLVQAFKGKEYYYIFPGIVVFGFGFHFYALKHFSFWPHHWSVLILFISIGMILQSRKTRADLLPGVILFIIGLFLLFNEKLSTMLGSLQTQISSFQQYWPIIIAVIGCYFLFSKK